MRHGKTMTQQPDSLHKATTTVTGEGQETAENTSQNVLQVNEDSTSQSIFTTKTSHWPVKIDSLLMPDQGKELKATVNPMPKYYKETFFAKDSLLHSELQGGRYGVAGDPVPYTLRNDDVLTPLLLLSILMLMLSVRRSSRFLLFQLRNFFHVVRTGSVRERESSADVRYLLFTEIYTTIILALLFFYYAKTYIAETYITYSEYSLMGMFLGVIIGFLAFEHLVEAAVNKIFFTPRESSLWTSTKMTVTCLGGVLLTPMLLLLAYFGMSIENALLYTLIVIILVKLLLFYKCYQIFFSKRGAFLQFFLYFCTLEIIPPLLAWGVLVTIANILTVNY